jgi:hypothetical protein
MEKRKKSIKAPASPVGSQAGRGIMDEDDGLPPEVALDEEAGLEPKAMREVGDADEVSAHGPNGDGAVATGAPDGQGLATDSDQAKSIDEL